MPGRGRVSSTRAGARNAGNKLVATSRNEVLTERTDAIGAVPARLVAAAGALGVIFGLLRIAWIIVASIFLYHIAVETGQFQVMKDSITALSTDKRLQLILIAFCFGAFLEGTGGGGAPVAISGSFLIGLGFEPFQAATLCLIANTAPVAWGAVGNPIRALTTVTGLPKWP